MSGKSTIDQIRHYQKDIEKCPDNAERMLRCIHRLYVLPITLEHLQETGVGRSVNSLRKYKGEVGDAAKALVTKWKAMVAAEESEEEAPQVPPIKPREIKVKSPPPVKSERKSDHHSKEYKEKSKSKEHSSNNVKHHSNKKSSHEKSHSSSSSKSPDKYVDNKSSLKRSHSSSSSSNHRIEKDKSSNHKIHKSHEKKHKIEDEESSPPPEKKHKQHSHSRDHSSKKKVSSESEEDSDASVESEADAESDAGTPVRDTEEEESEAGSESSNSDEESDSNSDGDHRHRSKKHASSHHNHKHSSHSKDRDRENKKLKEQNHKEKEKNKENHNHNKHSEKHSSKKKSSSSPDYKDLIKENEKKIKKEKKEEFVVPKIIPSKQIKLETNEDGSIDSGSGASFADALLGMDVYEKKKSKKSSSGTSSSSQKSKSTKSSSSGSSSSRSEEKPKVSRPSSSTRSIDELVEPPELLTKKVKLEALDLDISSTLPEINPNYKPLPHVPERSKQPKFMSDEDHMFSIMTTKNQRTKVFSGNKSCLTSVPTLFSMCIQLLYDNIDAVEYTGGVPYQLLKPLLQKLNADQLYVLEHFNSYLIEDTDELWKFHAQKEFRNEKRQDMESWRELYVRCMDERERKLKALTANITQSMANSTPVRQAKLAYVDAVVKPPRNVARKQAKFGTGNSSSASKNPTKHEIVSKAVVGGNTPGITVKDTVPPPPVSARAAVHHPTPTLLKKKKAPLMQKALQVMKGTRYKR